MQSEDGCHQTNASVSNTGKEAQQKAGPRSSDSSSSVSSLDSTPHMSLKVTKHATQWYNTPRSRDFGLSQQRPSTTYKSCTAHFTYLFELCFLCASARELNILLTSAGLSCTSLHYFVVEHHRRTSSPCSIANDSSQGRAKCA
eukprot:scaffold39184_cov23-Tisochrysis_lutea.AAC.5